MRHVVRVQRIGDEIGFVLPVGVVERYGLEEGDELFVVAQDGGVLLTKDSTYADAMHAYEEGARKYGNALRALADS